MCDIIHHLHCVHSVNDIVRMHFCSAFMARLQCKSKGCLLMIKSYAKCFGESRPSLYSCHLVACL
jgi:hypothetical protein